MNIFFSLLNCLFWAVVIVSSNPTEGVSLCYVQYIALAASLLGAFSSSGDDGNEKLAADAASAETKRRKRAAKEYAKAIRQYNKIRSKRPGMTLHDFLSEKADALGNDEFRRALQNSKREDIEEAQNLADRASRSNASTFDTVFQDISEGKGREMVQKRNEIALTDDSKSRLQRAIELSSPYIGAGTVKTDEQGNVVGRAGGQVVRIAAEEDAKARNEQFTKLSSIISSDRNLALSQQEKASRFLGFANFTERASNLSDQFNQTQIAFQKADEDAQFTLARDFAGSIASNQTPQPSYAPTERREQQFSDSLAALTKIASAYAGSGSGTTTGGL